MLAIVVLFFAAMFVAISLILSSRGKNIKVHLLISGELSMASSILCGFMAGHTGNWFFGVAAILVFISGTMKIVAATFPGKIKIAITSTN